MSVLRFFLGFCFYFLLYGCGGVNKPDSRVVLAINAGGGFVMGTDGIEYQQDQLFDGGTLNSTNDPIVGTPNGLIYQTQRVGDFAYEFDLPEGAYDITLKFSELMESEEGRNVLSVGVNMNPMIRNRDMVSAPAGNHVAYDIELPNVRTKNGKIYIGFFDLVPPRMASVSAIVVREAVR